MLCATNMPSTNTDEFLIKTTQEYFDKLSLKSYDDSSSTTSNTDDIENEDLDNDRHECLLEIPSREILEQIVAQVENYFTDENLIRDEFLMKNIRRNKEGYVNITLVASLRRVKAIIKLYPNPKRLLAHAIDIASSKLELNCDGTKIRRKVPLPPIDGNKYNRTVIITHIPEDKVNVDLILNDFSTFGLIESARIYDLRTAYPSHNKLLKYVDQQTLDILNQNQLFATIEFNYQDDAKNCCRHYRTILIHHDPIWSDVELHLLKSDP